MKVLFLKEYGEFIGEALDARNKNCYYLSERFLKNRLSDFEKHIIYISRL